MSRFLEYANGILETVEATLASGGTPSDMTIVIERHGGIRLISGCDWPLEALERERSASMAYHISRRKDSVTIEGRSGGHSCRLETAAPERVAKALLSSPLPALYHVSRSLPAPQEPPVRNLWQ